MINRVKTNKLVNSAPAISLRRDGSCSFHPAFPLTPALSRGERENHSPPFGGRERGVSHMRVTKTQNIQMLFPLPAGEGQGEGKRIEAQCLARAKSL